MNKFKVGDKVSLIPGERQWINDVEVSGKLTLTVATVHFIPDMFYSLEYKHTTFGNHAFELSYIQDFQDKLENLINE